MLKLLYTSLFVAGLCFACQDDVNSANSDNTATTSFLVSATPSNKIDLKTLQAAVQLSGQEEYATLVKYGVQTYNIVYQTIFNGQSIQASGLLYVPQGMNEAAPLISLQHGTTFVKKDAPSVSGEFSGLEFFAAAGSIAIMPDFIGYGESDEIFHPYYDEKSSALAVIDMIRSVKEFLEGKNIKFTDKLFLAGYSEGGYVTLAAAKEIETNPAYAMNVTAVAAGAGGYELPEMLKTVTVNANYAYPSYLAFVLMAYNNTYHWNKPLNYFFKDQYAQALSTYLNGEYDGGFINRRLTTNVKSLLNADFYHNLKLPEGEAQLKQALQNNSVAGWKTRIPIRLYHGTADEIIPFENSEVTLENFKTSGSRDVSLTSITGGTHGSSFLPMLRNFVPWFETLK